MWGKDKHKDHQPENNNDGTPALADRVGTYTPDMEDRRRIAVAELVMVAVENGGMLYAQDFSKAVLHNVDSFEELMPLTLSVKTRIMKIAQGGEY